MAQHGDVRQWFEVGPVAELKQRKCRRLYTTTGNDLALFCVKEEKFFATTAICPHARGPIDQGDIEDIGNGSYAVTCPVHYFTFDLVSGSSPSGLKLCIYETEIRDGQLYVCAPEQVYLKYVKKTD